MGNTDRTKENETNIIQSSIHKIIFVTDALEYYRKQAPFRGAIDVLSDVVEDLHNTFLEKQHAVMSDIKIKEQTV